MTLAEFNGLPFGQARSAMLDCCGCEAWAVEMAAKRPYHSLEALYEAADKEWWRLGEYGWLEALRAHPRTAAWTDIADLTEPDEVVAERMALLHEYYATFGFGFIHYAVGLSSDQIMKALRTRVGNRLDEELTNSVAEQAKITKLKLGRLINP
jgi:2-oxo-4-hydroxy-4-carboxy-5-ureidoimidazoline decarboxylase